MTACLLILGACNAPERGPFEGTWRMASYLKADTQVRYETDGYMMFDKTHWLHLMYFNRDERDLDFSEAHHGTYKITGPDTFTMGIDMELHMDPKSEYQETPVWYGPPAHLEGAKYRVDGNRVIMDLPSSAQLVLERVE
jgi:hypothetical protein